MRKKDDEGRTLYPFTAICQDGENGSAKLLAVELGLYPNDRELRRIIDDPSRCPPAVRPYSVLGLIATRVAARHLRERAKAMGLPYDEFTPAKRTHRLRRRERSASSE